MVVVCLPDSKIRTIAAPIDRPLPCSRSCLDGQVDINQALSGIDKLLKSQELTFAFVGVAPALAIVYAAAGYVRGIWSGGKGQGRYGGTARRSGVWLTMRSVFDWSSAVSVRSPALITFSCVVYISVSCIGVLQTAGAPARRATGGAPSPPTAPPATPRPRSPEANCGHCRGRSGCLPTDVWVVASVGHAPPAVRGEDAAGEFEVEGGLLGGCGRSGGPEAWAGGEAEGARPHVAVVGRAAWVGEGRCLSGS